MAVLGIQAGAADPPQVAFVSHTFSNYISAFDLTTNSLLTNIEVQLYPSGMAITTDGSRLYAATSGNGDISVVDANGFTFTGVLAGSAYDVALTPDNTRLYASSFDEVGVYDLTTALRVGVIPGSNGWLAMSPDGTRVYTGLASGNVSVIDTTANMQVATVAVGKSPTRLAVHPIGTRLWVVNFQEPNISIMDTARNRVTDKVRLSANPVALAFSPDGTRAFVIENAPYVLEVIETNQNRIIGSVPLSTYANDIAVSADGSRLYLTRLLDNAISVLDADTYATVATIPTINPFYIQLSPVPATASRVYVDIKPGDYPNSINSSNSGTVTVAILSTTTFNSVGGIDLTSIRFGRTGTEASPISCQTTGTDVNNDGLPDLVCQFNVTLAGFQLGDTKGLISGTLVSGNPFQGQDSVRVVQ